MSMAMALQGVRDLLRSTNQWDEKQCGLQENGIPPAICRSFYAGIDETSVTSANESNYYLGEAFAISVHVSRNVAWIPKDYQGNALLKSDPYLQSILTMDDLERKVILSLHDNWALTNIINDHWNLPNDNLGDVFIGSLSFIGRTKTRDLIAEDGNNGTAFKSRELRFRGLKRNQSHNCKG